MTGYLSLNNVTANRKASIRLSKTGETLYLDPKQIKAYKTDLGVYELKLLHPYNNSLSLKKQKPFFTFVKTISQGNTLFNVYEYEERVSEIKSSLPKTIKHYYISLPGEMSNDIWDVNGEVFSPDFNTKTRELFNSDRSLVAKINSKESAYYFRSFSFRQTDKAKILLNLLSTYQNKK